MILCAAGSVSSPACGGGPAKPGRGEQLDPHLRLPPPTASRPSTAARHRFERGQVDPPQAGEEEKEQA
jgi:hypothetical protein